MIDFEFENKSKLFFGVGKIKMLGELCKKTGKKPMLITTQKIIEENDFGKKLLKILDIIKGEGFDPVIYDEAVPNPTTKSIDEAAEIAIKEDVDFVIGIGGGSGVDTAKAVGIAQRLKDQYGIF